MTATLCLSLLAVLQAQGQWQDYNGSAANGGVSNAASSTGFSAMVLDGNGAPVIAWSDPTPGNNDIFLRRWNGTAWVGIDGAEASVNVSNTPGGSVNPVLRITPSGTPIVAWLDDSDPAASLVYEICVRRWNGTAWVGMGGTDASVNVSKSTGINSTYASIDLDPAGNPVVAWEESVGTGGAQIYVRHWNGSDWVGYGASDTGAGISNVGDPCISPDVKVDASGRPSVLWYVNSVAGPGVTAKPARIFLKRWTGSDWVELGGSATAGGINNRSTGTASFYSIYPSLALDGAGNPAVAWSDNSSGNAEIYYRRWNSVASTWDDLLGSGNGGGVSNTTGNSRYAALTLDASGYPVIAWSDVTPGNWETYLRRWNGSAWIELAGSASNGGISANGGAGFRPFLALDRFGSPLISWPDNTVGFNQIYFTRFIPPPAPPLDPAAPAQFQVDGAASLADGGGAKAGSFRVTAAVDDPNGDAVKLQVEVRPASESFTGSGTGLEFTTGVPVPAGMTAFVAVTGLPDEVIWHWQVRAIDATGRTSGWVVSPSGFTTPFNAPPLATSIEQVQIWDRGVVSTLLIDVVPIDPNGDQVRLEVEIRRIDEAYSGQPTLVSAYVASGTPIQIPVEHMADGVYRWRYQTRDSLGKTTGWITYGDNPEDQADFAFPPFGSSGKSKCTGSAARMAAWPGMALLSLLAFARMRRS